MTAPIAAGVIIPLLLLTVASLSASALRDLPAQPDVRQYNPTFNATSLFSHDPWRAVAADPHRHDITAGQS